MVKQGVHQPGMHTYGYEIDIIRRDNMPEGSNQVWHQGQLRLLRKPWRTAHERRRRGVAKGLKLNNYLRACRPFSTLQTFPHTAPLSFVSRAPWLPQRTELRMMSNLVRSLMSNLVRSFWPIISTYYVYLTSVRVHPELMYALFFYHLKLCITASMSFIFFK